MSRFLQSSCLLLLSLLLSLSLLSFSSAQSNSTSNPPSTSSTSPLPEIIVSGANLLLSSTSSRFIVRGAAYEYPVHDLAASEWQPALDRLLSSSPDINTIRLYDVNPDHTYVNLIEWAREKGIYLLVPLTPNSYEGYNFCVLNRLGTPDRAPTTCYPSCLLAAGQRVM